MTSQRKFKRRIRERMARTGESYSTARAVFAQRARTTIMDASTVMVPVTDMPRAIAFYSDALGFPLLGRASDDTWAELGDASTRLALHPNATPGIDLGLGLLVEDIDVLETAIAQRSGRIVERGASVTIVADPDGNTLRCMMR